MRISVSILAPLALVAAGVAQGRTLHVPAQYKSIQAAIDIAVATDTVLVAPGTYVENIDFKGKAIAVRSSDGPAVTAIDGNRKGSAVVFVTGEQRNSVLEGFTITRGTGTALSGLLGGGGIFCDGTSPTIRGNVVSGNSLAGPTANGGGGILCANASMARIVGNTISHNTVGSDLNAGGGGIACFLDASPTITDNAIFANSAVGTGLSGAGGILCQARCNPLITRNRIFRNTSQFGGGMQINYESVPTITDNAIFENTATASGGGIQYYNAALPVRMSNNTIYGNTAGAFGGGIYCNTDGSLASVRNGIVWGNKAPNGDQIAVVNNAWFDIDYSDVEGGKAAVYLDTNGKLTWGAGMLDVDPQLTAPSTGDLRLRDVSQCIDAGDPASDLCFATDLAGNPRQLDGRLRGAMRVDMGAHEYGNVHLEIDAPACRGTALTVETGGKSGLSVFLVLAPASGQLCLPPFGGILLDPTAPWLVLPWGTVPSVSLLEIPYSLTTPQLVVFQQLALDRSLQAGNVSNAVAVTIR